MEMFSIYLLKSTGILLLFLVCYLLFLRKETFFNHTRWFLLIGLFFAIGLPLVAIEIPVIVDSTPIYFIKNVVDIPVTSIATTELPTESNVDWWFILTVVYSIGALVIVGKLITQLFSLRKLISTGKLSKFNGISIIETTKEISPFSFMNYIIYNPKKHQKLELYTILKHEEFHVRKRHSLDIILAHILLIFHWFNPLFWWYKKLIQQNLEFATDCASVSINDKKEYQYLLLKMNSNSINYSLSNPFYNSLIKKRIIMLNKKQSHKRNLLKYATILPMLVGFVVLFNTKTIAQTTIKDKIGDFNFTKEFKGKNPIFIVDGILYKNKQWEDIDTGKVEYLEVYKDEKAIEKYGNKGKNGALVVRTIGSPRFSFDPKVTSGLTFYSKLDNKDKPDINTAVILIDGIESTKSDLENIMVDDISGMSDVNTGSQEEIVKYGNKAKNGIVRFRTWKNAENYRIKFPSSKQPLPLTIIDGKEVRYKDINEIDKTIDENVIILKGKKATDKYGAKAKNGVIEITTKRK